MTEFQIKLLNRLLDKFENGVKPKILCNSREPLFSDYFGKKSYIYRPGIEKDVLELSEKGFVSVAENQDNELKSVSLNLDESEHVFECIGRKSKHNIDNECLSYIEKKLSSEIGPVTCSFLKDMKNLIESGKKHKNWFESSEDIEKTASMVCAIEQHTENELLRNFSKRIFDDSKAIERNAPTILSVFKKYGNFDYETFDDVIVSFGIKRNPGYILIRGPVSISVNGLQVDVGQYCYTFCLPEQALDVTKISKVHGKNIVTVENLTTFNTIVSRNSIIIYLGGFSSYPMIKFLKMLEKQSDKCQWYHFSDIDVGGFRIFNDIRNKTGIDFKPLLMGIRELKKYKSQCQSLSDFDFQNLSRMKNESEYSIFQDTINFMLKNNIKLEQESIKFSIAKPDNSPFSSVCNQMHSFTVYTSSTWYCPSVHIFCQAEVNVMFCVSDPKAFKIKFKDEKLDETSETILDIVKSEFQKFLDWNFEGYVTAEKYYEPVIEDYACNNEDDIVDFFASLGLEVKNLEINTSDSGYIEN